MSNDFHLMVLKIPNEITMDYIKSLKEKVSLMDVETTKILNNFLSYDIEDVDVSDELEEEDLFSLTSDDIKIRKVAKNHLLSSIDKVLTHRLGMSNRLEISLSDGDIKYIKIEDSMYAISGYTTSYMTKRMSTGYCSLVALNISGIMS